MVQHVLLSRTDWVFLRCGLLWFWQPAVDSRLYGHRRTTCFDAGCSGVGSACSGGLLSTRTTSPLSLFRQIVSARSRTTSQLIYLPALTMRTPLTLCSKCQTRTRTRTGHPFSTMTSLSNSLCIATCRSAAYECTNVDKDTCERYRPMDYVTTCRFEIRCRGRSTRANCIVEITQTEFFKECQSSASLEVGNTARCCFERGFFFDGLAESVLLRLVKRLRLSSLTLSHPSTRLSVTILKANCVSLTCARARVCS